MPLTLLIHIDMGFFRRARVGDGPVAGLADQLRIFPQRPGCIIGLARAFPVGLALFQFFIHCQVFRRNSMGNSMSVNSIWPIPR